MSLLNDLRSALSPVIDFATSEFGVPCTLERVTEGAVTDLGTPSRSTVALPGVTNPQPVLCEEISRVEAQKGWGLDEDGVVRGIVNLSVPLLKGDRVTPLEGELAGGVFEVVARRPTEGGSLLQFVMRKTSGAAK